MSHFKKITKIIVNIFTCILLLLLVLVIYGKVVVTFTDNSYPNYFGYTFFEVASGSMEPTLKVNDVILIKIGKDNLNKGDIIAFNSENAIITHRILFIDGEIITVKGDNNDVIDKPIVYDQVIGKVVKIFPELGIWKKVVTEPKILLGIFVTLLLFDFALSYGNKDKVSKKDDVKVISEESKEEIAKQIEPVKETPMKKIESVDLLELTRKINIDEINQLLEGTEYKLEKKEINNIKKEVNKIEQKQEEYIKVDPELNENERKALEYTMRLDLNEIQNRIRSKVK